MTPASSNLSPPSGKSLIYRIDFVIHAALSLLLAPANIKLVACALQFASNLNTFEFLENSSISRFNQELFCFIPYSSIQMNALIQYKIYSHCWMEKWMRRRRSQVRALAHDVTQAIIPLTLSWRSSPQLLLQLREKAFLCMRLADVKGWVHVC